MPHRAILQRLLADYRGRVTAEEEASYAQLVTFVNREPRCFERSLAEGHITGSAWIVSPSGDRFLLTHHRKLGMWLQCGGHADGDPDVLSVALREATEESGIVGIEPVAVELFDVDVHQIPANPKEPAHLHYDVRFALRAPSLDFVVSDESHDLAWVTEAELPGYDTDASVRRMAKKWSGRRAS